MGIFDLFSEKKKENEADKQKKDRSSSQSIDEFLEKHRKLRDQKKKELIDVDIGDPAPTNQQERAQYVARVAEFHTDVLEPKIKEMLSTVHNHMEEFENDREHDAALKGVAFAFREFIVWGDKMKSEHMANMQDDDEN